MNFKIKALCALANVFILSAQAMEQKIVLPEANILYPLYQDTEIYDSNSVLGKYLRASKDLPQGTVVAKFEGPLTQNLSNRHSKWVGQDKEGNDLFIVVESSAVYVNHSCDPNCTVNTTDWSVTTTRDVKKNDALTISYNNKADFSPHLAWDPSWNFDCSCGTMKCSKRITGWSQ